MKRLVFAALLLATLVLPHAVAQSGGGGARRVWIEKADVAVRLTGFFAETEFDLTFRNDGDRAEEGEFALPLPPGATVSGYALDVNGRMRDAVSVEKERARTAYETVKRRMIDPGIVEREAENIYRTKVYPIPARGTKRLIIRYHETLAEGGQGLEYRLPFGFSNRIGSFSCRIQGRGFEIMKTAGLEFSDDGTGASRCSLADGRPQGVLELKVKPPTDGTAVVDGGSNPAFHLKLRESGLALRPIPKPGTVMLLWDASGSLRGIDHKETFALLNAWFAKLGNTKVRLRLVRDRIEDAGEFEVGKGGWMKLRRKLEQVAYDGASDFSRIEVPASEADMAVWVTDGQATLGDGMPRFGVPLALIGCGEFSLESPVVRQFSMAGASVIDLSREQRDQALAKLTHQAGGLLGVAGDLAGEAIVERDPVSGTIEVFGRLRDAGPRKLELHFGYGREVTLTREVSCEAGLNDSGTVGRILAQRQLAELESNPETRPEAIIEHCKKHGLVSGFTSLIVLERIEDYAEHGIVPPEPELRGEYDKLVERFAAQRRADLGGLAYEWADKTAWHARKFPGHEGIILPRMKQVAIWRKAVESQFPPGQRDMEAFNTVAGWHDRAMQLVAGKNSLKTPDEYDKWKEGIDRLHEEGFKLADTPLHSPPEGSELAVSVRGLVAKPGVVEGAPKMTLKQAVANAGGPGLMGSLDNVALYRNAGKTVYNTLSERFTDVPLFPADMIVVGGLAVPDDGSVDPFAAEPSPADVTKEAPVRGQADVWITRRVEQEWPGEVVRAAVRLSSSSGSFPITPGTPSSVRSHVPKMRDRLAPETAPKPRRMIDGNPTEVVELPETAAADFVVADFEKELAAGVDAASVYESFRARCGGDPGFYPQAARVLASRNHPALARRALSNLAEDGPDRISAKRAYAFWLAEIGQSAEAEAVLDSIRGDDRSELLAKRDLASMRAARGDWDAAYDALAGMTGRLPQLLSGPLAGITLTEIKALLQRSSNPAVQELLSRHEANLAGNLHADLRFVVTAASGTDDLWLEVTEPGGFACADGSSPSPYGGRLCGASGVKEYMIRRAVPGVYQIRCRVSRPTTLRIEIQTDFGRDTCKTKVVTLDAGDKPRLPQAEFEFGFRPWRD